ncbi:hypothetical protein ES705_19838 [subsurface metagenome]
MAGDPIPMQHRVKGVYTFNEAVELMKMYDKYPTGHTWNWIDVNTRQSVVIGYND